MKKQANTTHFFYQNGKLVTVNQGAQHRAIFRSADIPLAEQHTDDGGGLLVTDDKGSVLTVITDSEEEHHAFSVYGYDSNIRANSGLLGFNGEYLERVPQCYLLGAGHHRAFSTSVMRFLCADSWSPFGKGGLNAYSYCENDPINHSDPSGHFRQFLKRPSSLFGHQFRPKFPKDLSPTRSLPAHTTADNPNPDLERPPSYAEASRAALSANGLNIGADKKPFQKNILNLESLQRQYDKYEKQQTTKQDFVTKDRDYHEGQKMRHSYGVDMWSYHNRQARKANARVSHYDRKVQNLSTEMQKLSEHITSLRGST